MRPLGPPLQDADAVRPKPRLSSLRLLVPFMRPYLGRVLGATLSLATAAGLVLGLGQGLRHLIDDGFGTRSQSQLNQAALIMFGVVAMLAVATFARFYLVSWLGERLAADLRRAVFDRVIALSPAFFETMRTGDILSRMTADISVLQALVGSAISMWLRNLLMLLGAVVMLVVTSPKLAGLILIVVPFVVVPIILFGRREKLLSRVAQDRVADLGAYAEEAISGLATVQAFPHEPVDRRNFSALVEQSVAAAVRRGVAGGLLVLGGVPPRLGAV